MSKKKNLIIINAGKFGREVYTWVIQTIHRGEAWVIKGFLDDRPSILRDYQYDVPILGPVEEYIPQQNDVFLCAIGEPKDKKRFCSIIQNKGGYFATLIHPTAVIGLNVKIGAGSIIGPLTQLSCDIVLGKYVCFGTHSSTGHDTKIGDYAQINGSCEINGNAVLEEGVFLGSHATILPKAHVGAWAFVGAGSVVLRRVAPRTKVFGNPAVSIGASNGP